METNTLHNTSLFFGGGRATDFVYTIKNISQNHDIFLKLNSEENIKTVLKSLIRTGCTVEFLRLDNPIFLNNLLLIDSYLPKILAELILMSYLNNDLNMNSLVHQIERKNPLKFDTRKGHQFYLYKVKHFLTQINCGMTPTEIWYGKSITADNRNKCLSLINHTELEHISIVEESQSFKFGWVYEENGSYFIKLNLQIRFK